MDSTSSPPKSSGVPWIRATWELRIPSSCGHPTGVRQSPSSGPSVPRLARLSQPDGTAGLGNASRWRCRCPPPSRIAAHRVPATRDQVRPAIPDSPQVVPLFLQFGIRPMAASRFDCSRALGARWRVNGLVLEARRPISGQAPHRLSGACSIDRAQTENRLPSTAVLGPLVLDGVLDGPCGRGARVDRS